MTGKDSNLYWVNRAQALDLRVRNFLDGRWSEGPGGTALSKYSPRDGGLLLQFGAGQAHDVDLAVASARRAFDDGRWANQNVERRKEVLYRLAELLERHREDLALLECIDVGKPITDALEVDVPMAIAAIRYSAEAADKLGSKVYHASSSNLSYELRRPVGVVAGIIGWNFPLALAASKIGPTLATGNSLVLKPSELTSLSAARVAELATEAGVPNGVLNVIHGDGSLGSALARHNEVDLVSFTGSTQTGKRLLIAAGESNMKRLILECGGKAPNIVFEDGPPLESIVDLLVRQMFWNQGQVCTASSRLLVHHSVESELLALLTERCEALGMGDPMDPKTKFGALVSREHREKVRAYIRIGEEQGARIAYRSKATAPFESGFYLPPVMFDRVTSSHKIAQEEIFGPVISVVGFRDEAEAIRIANDTIYGLSAIVWTRDMGRGHRLSQALRAGWIIVNASGSTSEGVDGITVGGHKQSGVGVEGGITGLEAYTTSTAVQYFV